VLIITYGHESRGTTERVLSQVDATDRVTLHNKLRSCKICEARNIEPLLQIEKFQLYWFSHVTRTSQEEAGKRVPLATATGK